MLPLCVLAVGAVVVAIAARRLVAEVAALRPSAVAVGQLRDDARALLRGAEVARRHGAELGDVAGRMRRARASVSDPKVGGIDR